MKGFGYEVLDIEKELFKDLDTETSREMLDEVVDAVSKKIRRIKKPEKILGRISIALDELGFVYGHFACGSFHEQLKGKRLACRDYTYIYMTIAEKSGLSLAAARAPAHVFVRLYDKSNRVDWETTCGRESCDDLYRQKFRIVDTSTKKGYFLKDLARENVFSIALHNLGMILINEVGDYEKALGYMEMAIRADPTYELAWCGKGVAYSRLERHAEAMECYEETLKLHPNSLEAMCNIGATYNDLGKHKEAIRHCDRALGIDPTFWLGWGIKGHSYEGLGDNEKAKDCFEKADFYRTAKKV